MSKQGLQLKEYNFSCSNCDEPFEVSLPDETTRTSYEECEDDDDDARHHNRTRVWDCLNCEQDNTIYYCTLGHDGIMYKL